MKRYSLVAIGLCFFCVMFSLYGMEKSMQETQERERLSRRNAFRSVDMLKFFICTGEYNDAWYHLVQNQDKAFFAELLAKDPDIGEWYHQHGALLLAVKNLIVISKKMELPYFFLRNMGGRRMDADMVDYLLKNFKIENITTLKPIVFLMRKMYLFKMGVDFFDGR